MPVAPHMYRKPYYLLTMLAATFLSHLPAFADSGADVALTWKSDYLTISSERLPTGKLKVHYLEAFCRDKSADRAWEETVIRHGTALTSAASDGKALELQSTLADGVVVDHRIATRRLDPQTEAIDFRLVAVNPTAEASHVHWAQPCIRVAEFTGCSQENYLSHCFVFVDGRLARLPTQPWAEQARYTPGQVYCPAGVNRGDVNPRPLSALVPSNGLIGCFSQDERLVLATAWQPYQELFQGVGTCIHSDFRIGGLPAGERKEIRGAIYITSGGVDNLLKHYAKDFPEHSGKSDRTSPH
jgi:hypothetical protein